MRYAPNKGNTYFYFNIYGCKPCTFSGNRTLVHWNLSPFKQTPKSNGTANVKGLLKQQHKVQNSWQHDNRTMMDICYTLGMLGAPLKGQYTYVWTI